VSLSLIYNERTKLLATALNNMAVATMATAIIAPIAGIMYGSASFRTAWWPLFGLVWFLVGLGLHIAGQGVLGRLKG
jgi:hypothetical protein